jgi:NhaP-type Na+/H+ and K+/H+ antiporter
MCCAVAANISDWYFVWLCLQIMVLAWPGVVVQFLLIALCAKYVFPYDWSWPEAFLFGAMMSATDPVAVVAVLQEVCCCPKCHAAATMGTNLCSGQNWPIPAMWTKRAPVQIMC